MHAAPGREGDATTPATTSVTRVMTLGRSESGGITVRQWYTSRCAARERDKKTSALGPSLRFERLSYGASVARDVARKVHVPLMQDAKVSHVVDPVLDVQG
jgi:hypothetical protein